MGNLLKYINIVQSVVFTSVFLFALVVAAGLSDISWFVFLLTEPCRGPDNTDTHSLEISECLESPALDSNQHTPHPH